jgi:DNA-binding transcriptional MerR regulator/methylmalonyl-CoA mutase cobalamin-binding subunit
MSTEQSDALFPISTVSNLTGVNSVTLRAWERRYGLINPTRTASGHRLYSDQDVELIKHILELLDTGITISRVKEALRQQDAKNQSNDDDSDHWQQYIDQMLRGVNSFDESLLDGIYNEAMSLYPVDVVTKQLLVPLLEKLGQRWEHVSTGVAEEHFFSVFMRNKLGARFHHRNLRNKGPRLLAACLPGEQHEFGLLLFSLAAHARGYRIVLLGADMPVSQLAEVVHRANCNGIILSSSIENYSTSLTLQLEKLVRDSGVPVWVGGRTSEQLKDKLEATGVTCIGRDLIVGLHQINKSLPIDKETA